MLAILAADGQPMASAGHDPAERHGPGRGRDDSRRVRDTIRVPTRVRHSLETLPFLAGSDYESSRTHQFSWCRGGARVVEVSLMGRTRSAFRMVNQVALVSGMSWPWPSASRAATAPAARSRPAAKPGSAKARGECGVPGNRRLRASHSGSKSQAKMVSTIEGDRMTVVSPPSSLTQADRVEPVPLRRDRQGSRHRLRPLLGDDRGEVLPHGQRLGRGDLRLRQRRPARPLFRHRARSCRWAPP